MKILLITHQKNHGALRSYHFGLHLVKMGHQVTHVSISYRSRYRMESSVEEGMEILETPDLLWGRARSGWDLWDTINRILYFK